MQALVFSEPSPSSDTTAVREVPTPRPGPGQVGIEVTHAGINFIDVMARRGDDGYAPAWPYVPGLEVAGVVRELGTGVADLAPGDRVAALTRGGGLAQIAVADAELTMPVPEAVSPRLAAAAPLMLSTAVLLLEDVARLRPGERLLMHSAAGGVGAAVAQLAGTIGAGETVGSVGDAARVAAAERQGWDTVLVRDERFADTSRAAGGSFDVILDPTGGDLLDLLELAAPGARVVIFGNAGGGAPPTLPAAGRLIGANVSIAGFSISRLATAAPERVAAALRRSLALLEEDRVSLPVSELDSLPRAAETHDLLAQRRGQGKYVVAIAPA